MKKEVMFVFICALVLMNSVVLAVDFVVLEESEASLLKELPLTSREEFPELFKDRTLELLEIKMLIKKISAGVPEVYKLHCDTYQKLNEMLKTGNLSNEPQLIDSYSDELNDLRKRCKKYGHWR